MSAITRIMLIVATLGWSGLSNSANQPLPLETFTKFAQFRQIVISPGGEYLAASLNKEDGSVLVTILDITNLKQLSVIEFKLGDLPSELTWLNNTRIGIRIAKKIGALDAPVPTPEYYAMDADGKRKTVLWGGVNDKGHATYRSFMGILHLLPDDPETILVTEQSGNGSVLSYPKAYELNVYTGRTKKVASAPIRGAQMLSDHDMNVRFAIGADPDDDNSIKTYYRASNNEDWELSSTYESNAGKVLPVAFTANNKEIYALSDMDGPTQGLVKLKPGSNNVELIYRHDKVDLSDLFFSQDMKLVSARISPDRTYNQTLSDHSLAKWIDSLQNVFPEKTVTVTSTTTDESKLIVYVSSASDPGAYYLFDTSTKQMQFIVNSAPWINPDLMAPVKPFSITSRDGLELNGYLTLPPGKSENQLKDLPLIIHPHGGPHGVRDNWTFTPDAQVLASRGYAVIQLNYRGSGGYGNEFLQAGYRKWGREMQNDLTDATQWAIDTGLADKDRICIYGASYGGYATMMGVVKEPDLYKCAIAYVGVYSLPMMYEEGDIPERQSGINYLNEVLGTDQTELEQWSPAYHVDKIKAALFLVHGAKDQRVPIEQMEFLKSELDKRNYPYEELVKEKEGHGFYDEQNRLELYKKMLTFLDKHIGS